MNSESSTLNVNSMSPTEMLSSESNDDIISSLEKQRINNPKNIIIGHLNINSIKNKFESLK